MTSTLHLPHGGGGVLRKICSLYTDPESRLAHGKQRDYKTSLSFGIASDQIINVPSAHLDTAERIRDFMSA